MQKTPRLRFRPWVRKIPWRRKWDPTPEFLPRDFMDRGAWGATVHGVMKSQTQLNMTVQTPQVEVSGPWEGSPPQMPTKCHRSPDSYNICLIGGSHDLWIQLFARMALRTQENTYLCSPVYCIIKDMTKDIDEPSDDEIHRRSPGGSQHGCPVPMERWRLAFLACGQA